MREITSHVVEGDDRPAVVISPSDNIGNGGAPFIYYIGSADDNASLAVLRFQQGDPREGWNGITNEALLAIVADRLECFQAGPFADQNNATALSNINNAMRALQQRTLKRIARGVEGKSVA